MSTTEILQELPKLTPEDLDAIFYRAAELRQHAMEVSPELLAAIDEADQSFQQEGGVSLKDARCIAASWNTK